MPKKDDVDALVVAGFLLAAAGGVYLVLKAFGCFEEGEEITPAKIYSSNNDFDDSSHSDDFQSSKADILKCSICGEIATTFCGRCRTDLCNNDCYSNGLCWQCDNDDD